MGGQLPFQREWVTSLLGILRILIDMHKTTPNRLITCV